jgi:hypothetical protein
LYLLDVVTSQGSHGSHRLIFLATESSLDEFRRIGKYQIGWGRFYDIAQQELWTVREYIAVVAMNAGLECEISAEDDAERKCIVTISVQDDANRKYTVTLI